MVGGADVAACVADASADGAAELPVDAGQDRANGGEGAQSRADSWRVGGTVTGAYEGVSVAAVGGAVGASFLACQTSIGAWPCAAPGSSVDCGAVGGGPIGGGPIGRRAVGGGAVGGGAIGGGAVRGGAVGGMPGAP